MTAFAVLSLIGVSVLSGCAQPADAEGKKKPPAASAAPSAAAPSKAPASAASKGGTQAADRPSWAVNPTAVGDLTGEGNTESWGMQIFRVGNAKTSSDGIWAMPDTKELIMPKGTEMTFYNLVYTNTSDHRIVLDESLGTVIVKHGGVEDYKEVLSSHDEDVFQGLGISERAFDLAKLDEMQQYGDERGYPVEPGQSFAIAASTWAVPGEITFEVYFNIMDEQGNRLVHDTEIGEVKVAQD